MMVKMKLTDQKCSACEGAIEPFTPAEAKKEMAQVPGWTLSGDAKTMSREVKMKNFVAAVKLIDEIAKVAEAENHHPDLHLTGYRNLRIDLSTHAVGGLTRNDLIVAAKINELPAEFKN